MRSIFYIVVITLALALLRWLVMDVVRAVKRSLGVATNPDTQAQGGRRSADGAADPGGNLVRDPVSGTYIDERLAIKEVIGGQVFYFESKANRDAYRKQAGTA